MENKRAYRRPVLTEWGTVADLTQNAGLTQITDSLQCGSREPLGGGDSCAAV